MRSHRSILILLRAQSEVQAACQKVLFLDDHDEEIRIFRAYVRLKVSGVHGEMDNEVPLFAISAEYRVDYLIRKNLTKAEMGEFTEYNAVHNVMAFSGASAWQQIVSEAKLPRITIPFFHRSPKAPKVKRTVRKTPAKKISEH